MRRTLGIAVLAVIAGLSTLVSRADAAIITYTAVLSGLNEDSPNLSPGTGSVMVTIDDLADTMRVEATFADLVAANTAAHIHCCTAVPGTGIAGVATATPTFPGFPAGTFGSYDETFELLPLEPTDTYNIAFVNGQGGTVQGAMAALLQGMDEGRAYFNIHSSVYPGGEIRGFLVRESDEVPEPATLSLIGFGIAAAVIRRRRR